MRIVVPQVMLVPLGRLRRLVLKLIHDETHMTAEELREMQGAFIAWKQLLDERKARAQDVDIAIVEALQDLAYLLRQNELGLLERLKWLLKDRRMDYRKFYRLPEAYTPEDFARGKALAEEDGKQYA